MHDSLPATATGIAAMLSLLEIGRRERILLRIRHSDTPVASPLIAVLTLSQVGNHGTDLYGRLLEFYLNGVRYMLRNRCHEI